jgi:FAD/FMN-containing dehydrogenase
MSQESKSTEFKAALSAAGFTGDLIIPGDSEYLPSLIRWARNAQKNAALVAFVKSAQDVSRVIELVNAYSARGNPVHMTIRGGGHDTTGASSSDGGIVVDLSRYLKTVRVDKEKKLAYVGGGATWADVDTKAITFGLATTGGNVNHAGVGG